MAQLLIFNILGFLRGVQSMNGRTKFLFQLGVQNYMTLIIENHVKIEIPIIIFANFIQAYIFYYFL